VLAGLGGMDDAVEGLADPFGGLVGVGLAGVQPGDDRFDRQHGGELGRPSGPGGVEDHPSELAVGGGHHGVVELVHLVAELRFPRGVAEQQPEPVGVLGGGGDQRVEMVGRLYGLPRREARRRAREVLERIHLADAADRPVKTYSGGMRRRLDLAASLVGRPQVLFLDEPTAGLDPASRHDLWELIGDLLGIGTTVLLTTQYLEEADQLADRVAVVDHGRLVGEGTGEQLKDRVGGAVVELRLPASDHERTLAALRDLGSQDPAHDQRTGKVVFGAPDGARTLTDALRRLDAQGINPTDATLRKPTLDDVFLALTGHRAAQSGNGPDLPARGGHHRQARHLEATR
jgi:ABC-type multidrug transport system ATPase subunit